jgi:hypothetical protein
VRPDAAEHPPHAARSPPTPSLSGLGAAAPPALTLPAARATGGPGAWSLLLPPLLPPREAEGAWEGSCGSSCGDGPGSEANGAWSDANDDDAPGPRPRPAHVEDAERRLRRREQNREAQRRHRMRAKARGGRCDEGVASSG